MMRPGITHVKAVNGKGRGVFALADCKADSILEEAFTIEIPENEFESVNKTVFRNYYFIRDHSSGHEHGMLVLGHISLLNHSGKPNAKFEFFESDLGVIARLTAKRDISSGEEITIDYEVPLWFGDVVDDY